MKVPLLDLKAQYEGLRAEIEPAIRQVFDDQYFILGPKVTEVEAAIAEYSKCNFGVGVSSGTDALLIALMTEGIGPGDEVITTPYTFFATAGSITRVGARPVFVDIDPVTFNLRVDQIEAALTENTRAIMPVHLYGQMADIARIAEIADRHELILIEDAAQAIGAEMDGHRAGSVGHYGCFSFFPSKNLGGAGDGGMVVTNDEDRKNLLVSLRNHGMEPKYYHEFIGGNFRLDALQAAVITIKLRHLDAWTEGRQANAARYDRLFSECGLAEDPVRLPVHPYGSPDGPPPGYRHIFNQYVIRIDRRDELRDFLGTKEIGTEVYYPVPLHLQECFSYLGYTKGQFPESEAAAKETLALPIYPELTDEQAAYVVRAISAFYGG